MSVQIVGMVYARNPPPRFSNSDRLFQDVVMENKKIRFGESLAVVMERSAVKTVYVDMECHSNQTNQSRC